MSHMDKLAALAKTSSDDAEYVNFVLGIPRAVVFGLAIIRLAGQDVNLVTHSTSDQFMGPQPYSFLAGEFQVIVLETPALKVYLDPINRWWKVELPGPQYLVGQERFGWDYDKNCAQTIADEIQRILAEAA